MLERCTRIEQEEAVDEDGTATKEKPAKEISQEISAIIRRITGLGHLPAASARRPCRSTVRALYTNAESDDAEGVAGERREVHRQQRRTGQAQVRSTSVHKVEGLAPVVQKPPRTDGARNAAAPRSVARARARRGHRGAQLWRRVSTSARERTMNRREHCIQRIGVEPRRGIERSATRKSPATPKGRKHLRTCGT